MDLDQLIEKLPLPNPLSVADAAGILGGPHWIGNLMHLVENGHLFSWTHSPALGEQRVKENNSLHLDHLLPRVGPKTNPAEVFIQGEEVLWRWCNSFEERLQGGVNPSKESVEERLKFVNDLASRRTAQALQAKKQALFVVQVAETKEQRQDRRLQACIEAGLPMDTRAALLRLPDGVGDVADSEGVTRQAFSTDVRAALKRRKSAIREGETIRRT